MKPLSRLIRRVSAGLAGILFCTVAGSAQTPTPASAGIDGVIAANTKVELVKGGADSGYVGLEGPMPTPDGGLYFTDIRTERIYKLDKDGNIAVWREKTGGANGLFLTKDGQLLAAEQVGKRVVSISPDGRVVPLVTEFNGKPLRRPNDLVMDRKGGIYFTDPAGDLPEPSRVLYRRPNGELVLIEDKVFGFPNGIMLSPDEKTLYVGDPRHEYIYAYDVQPDGSVKNSRPFIKLREPTQAPTGGLRSGADGLAVDSKGRLYVTSDNGIQVVDPSGEFLGIIRVPTKARSLAFAGPGKRTLYITAAAELYRVPMLSEGPSDRAK
jgi:gluconolactonase